ncbi:MAG: threonine synthase [Alphaproteobacteria bacterium GM202ARS2]|nr:threonine synthase [Alphaproteobacteria bacterium GM202ARS2]
MRYVSTRGGVAPTSFTDVLLQGLCADGGLFMPQDSLPSWSMSQLSRWQSLSYPQLAFEVTYPFVEGAIPADVYKKILATCWSRFPHPQGIPLTQQEAGIYLLELFHGPSLAFKDYALQSLGELFAYVLGVRDDWLTVLGATSGDTGAAAIEACVRHERMRICILHPHERIAPNQRRQMTTIDHPRVLNIAIKGAFDDCQTIVKKLFLDTVFAGTTHLAAVNSVNWARIMAQMVYYVHACLRVPEWHNGVSVCVPTGNFGNIFAGFMAKKMGLPLRRLIIASNHNDVLPRLYEEGILATGTTRPSLSPSMDIQIPSNFERMLYDLNDEQAAPTKAMMARLTEAARLVLSPDLLATLRASFKAVRVDDEQTKEIMARSKKKTGTLIDPHTAVGVAAALQETEERPIICLGTAHPAKFPDAVQESCGEKANHRQFIEQKHKREHYLIIANAMNEVKSVILQYFNFDYKVS